MPTLLAVDLGPKTGLALYRDDGRLVWYRSHQGYPTDTAIKEIDTPLHSERVTRSREKITYPAQIDKLPLGVFVDLEGEQGTAWLIWNGELLKWRECFLSGRKQYVKLFLSYCLRGKSAVT